MTVQDYSQALDGLKLDTDTRQFQYISRVMGAFNALMGDDKRIHLKKLESDEGARGALFQAIDASLKEFIGTEYGRAGVQNYGDINEIAKMDMMRGLLGFTSVVWRDLIDDKTSDLTAPTVLNEAFGQISQASQLWGDSYRAHHLHDVDVDAVLSYIGPENLKLPDGKKISKAGLKAMGSKEYAALLQLHHEKGSVDKQFFTGKSYLEDLVAPNTN